LYLVKDGKGDLIVDSHSITARWRNYFSPILNVDGVSGVRQAEIHTAEPFVPEPSALEAELVNEKFRVTNHQVLIKYQRNCLK
jgi:hypothetical protein